MGMNFIQKFFIDGVWLKKLHIWQGKGFFHHLGEIAEFIPYDRPVLVLEFLVKKYTRFHDNRDG
jgi:hypothetical protein